MEDAKTQAEIARIDNRIAVINKQIELANAETALTQRQGGTRVLGGIPQLIGISGPRNRLTAKFLYDGRQIVYARANDDMPSGYRLVTITPNNATLRKADQTITLNIAYSRDLPNAMAFPTMPANIPVDSAGPIIGRAPPPTR